METIHIFHTNDVHSHYEYWPRMTSFVKAQRNYLFEKGEPSFLVDVGDFVDRSNLYTEATLGKGCIALLNDAQYDVVTIGNNEGITLAHEELVDLYNDADFEVVVCNLQSTRKEQPKWLKKSTILETANGTKIGVIGATAQYELFYRPLDWHVEDAKEAVLEEAKNLAPYVDIIICLSHLGITEDELLAEQTDLIDIIFGAHTHHVFLHGKKVNTTYLTGGGKFGTYVGQATIQFDTVSKKVRSIEDRLHEIALMPPVSNEMEFINDLYNEAKAILNEPLYTLQKTYTKEWFHYSPLADLFSEIILKQTNADIALFNAGIFMDDLKKGNVSLLQLHQILPHPINLCTIELKASELKEIYRQAQNEEWPNKQLNGLGFRGVVIGKLLTYNFYVDASQQLYVNGELANMEQTYTLVTLDMFTFGFFFPSFKSLPKQYFLPQFIRDYLQKM